MSRHLFVVLSNARPDLEDEFNEWYSTVHIVELVDKIEGIEAAQRFALAGAYGASDPAYKYLAIYWIHEDRLDEVKAALAWQHTEREEALAAGRPPFISKLDAFDGRTQAMFFSSLTDRYTGAVQDNPSAAGQ